MKKAVTPAVLLSLCVALMIACASALRAETAAPAGAESLEKQIEQLRRAFIEALQTRDWKMLMTAGEGLKAAGLKGKDLEIAMLRAEREAALGIGGMGTFGGGHFFRPQVITWGLACRAKAGDASALETLRGLGKMNPQTIKPPDQNLYREDPAAAMTALKAHTEYMALLDERNNALLCLAMIKEPGILPRAIECLTAKIEKAQTVAHFMGGIGTGANALIEASIVADPQEGWKKLVEILNQEGGAVSFELKATVLQGIVLLTPKVRGDWGAARSQFKLESEISLLLPKDANEQLVKSYTALLKIWNPKEGGALDNSIQTLVNLALSLPKLPEDSEALTALVELKDKLAGDPNAQYLKLTIDQVLALHKAKPAANPNNPGAAAKPPKAPEDF